MRITSGFMTNLSGDNIDSSTGSGIEGEGLGSKSGGLAHGRRLDGGLGSKSGGLAHESGEVEILFQKVSENRLGEQRSGSANKEAAGQPKERRGGPQRGLRPKKGFRCFGAEVIIQ